MYGHFDSLSVRGGRPEPHVESVADQSMRLNQSPESYELRSSDFERNRSEPACQNDGPCDSAVVASATVFIRTRSSIDVGLRQLVLQHVEQRLVVVGVDVGDRLRRVTGVAGRLTVVVDVGAGDGRTRAVDELVVAQVAGQTDLDLVVLRAAAGLAARPVSR